MQFDYTNYGTNPKSHTALARKLFKSVWRREKKKGLKGRTTIHSFDNAPLEDRELYMTVAAECINVVRQNVKLLTLKIQTEVNCLSLNNLTPEKAEIAKAAVRMLINNINKSIRKQRALP